MNNPLVSVCMPLYNEEKFLSQSLESLLAQDYKNLEIIISDNSSTDKTQKIALEHIKKDGRIKYYRNEKNVGGSRNFNKTFHLSSGQYFMWASGHDLWERNFISSCLNVLERENNVVLVYPLTSLINADNNDLGVMSGRLDTRSLSLIPKLHSIIWGIANGNPVYGLMRREAMGKTALFQDVLGMDMIFLLELSLFGDFAHISQVLFYRREQRQKEKNIKASSRRVRDTYLGRKSLISLFPYWHLVFKNLMVIKKVDLNQLKKTGLFLSVFFNLIVIYGPSMLRDLKNFFKNLLP